MFLTLCVSTLHEFFILNYCQQISLQYPGEIIHEKSFTRFINVAGVGQMGIGLSQTDAFRRLNVHRSVVQQLCIQIVCVQKTCSRQITSYNTDWRQHSSSYGQKNQNNYCVQLALDYFIASGTRISTTTLRILSSQFWPHCKTARIHHCSMLSTGSQSRERFRTSDDLKGKTHPI